MTPHDRALVERLEGLCRLAREALPEEPIPCFGYLQVETHGRVRDLLLGWRTVSTEAVTVLDWQSAPLASVFFTHATGEDYELRVERRTLEGTLRFKALLDFHAGALVEIASESATLRRDASGEWRHETSIHKALLTPRDASAPRPPPPFTLEALDPAQRRAVTLDAREPLLLVGEAGCGKTTVALHRVAELQRVATREGRAFKALVLVPVEGLRRLSEIILATLGATDVKVRVFDRWAGVQARRAFGGISRRESRHALPSVVRLKRHPALEIALREVAGRVSGATATREDLQHVFGDRVLLERVAAASHGALSAHDVASALEHTRVQFTETAEQEFSHVDADRLSALDGLTLDASTPTEDAGAVDAEDYAVLFALAKLRETSEKRAVEPDRYDCVVVDETQEFAPIELQLIGRALRPGGALVVAGDEGQQVDPTAYFEGWEASMRSLHAAPCTRVELAVSYRCPPEVTALARAVLRREGASRSESSALAWSASSQPFHLLARLTDALRALRDVDPNASVAVVCRTAESARRMASRLGRTCDARLAERGDFRFAPGVEVTCVQEVKGLEFDYVVVADASASEYPDDASARRAMYVAVTRASQQALLMTAAGWSPLLSASGAPTREGESTSETS